MVGTKPIAVLVAAALLFGAVPLTAQEGPTAADYARREAGAPGLAEFQGGFHGVVIAIVVVAALVGCCVLVFDFDCPTCGHGHYHRLPPAEGRGPKNLLGGGSEGLDWILGCSPDRRRLLWRAERSWPWRKAS